MNRCPNCNNLNEEQDIHCNSCGKKLQEQFPKCPKCNSENKPGDSYCISCGETLTSKSDGITLDTQTDITAIEPRKKSSGLKIFLITLFSVIGVVIIVLCSLFFFTDIFTVKGTDYLSQDKKEISNELSKWKLSQEQQELIGTFGYPEEFFIMFNLENEKSRLETWLYKDMEVSFTFTEGKYNSSNRVVTDELLPDDYEIGPEDFVSGMKPEDIDDLLDDSGIVKVDSDTNFIVITYGEGLIVCTFDADETFLNILRGRRIRPDRG